MTLSQANAYLEAISQFAPEVCITGGEPFLYHRDIVELSKAARKLGLRVSIVTGAGWANKEAVAQHKLQALADAGVETIAISWDAYHAEQAPVAMAVTVARIATELGLKVAVRVTIPANASTDTYEGAFQGLPVIITRSRTLRLGRGGTLPGDQFQVSPLIPKGKCPVVLHPNIEPNGIVYACCGPSRLSSIGSHLRLGDTKKEKLANILARAVRDPILSIISSHGPWLLQHLLQDVECGVPLPSTRHLYSSICELCMDLTRSPTVVTALRARLSDIDAVILIDDDSLQETLQAP